MRCTRRRCTVFLDDGATVGIVAGNDAAQRRGSRRVVPPSRSASQSGEEIAGVGHVVGADVLYATPRAL
jgi:hypothetical protein